MKRLSESEVRKILKAHELWLKTNEKEGRFAFFFHTDLSGMSFHGLDLRDAIFHNACLKNADFRNANLRDVYFCNMDLTNVDFRGADLTNADFENTEIQGMLCDETTLPAMVCPEEGAFVGFKKVCDVRKYSKKYIVELRIPADAKRSSSTTNSCRCSKAEVLSITKLNGKKAYATWVRSEYDLNFIYRLGETVEVTNFDKCRWKECAPGIHFFMNREDAVAW